MIELRRMGLVASVVLLVAGCGGGGTTTTSSAMNWAGSVCSALTAWQTSVSDSAKSVTSSPSKATVQQAATNTVDATTTLADALEGLGAPETESGTQARTTVNQLGTQLRAGVTTIQTALDGATSVTGALAAASTSGNAVSGMSTNVKTATDTLDSLPKGELKQAFKDSPDCQALESSSRSS